MARIRDTRDKPQAFTGWPGGVDNVHDVQELQSFTVNGFAAPRLRSGVNIDLTADGAPRRRRGYTLTAAGYTHSLWSPDSASFALLVKDAVLTRVRLDGETEVLDALGSVHVTRRMAYTEAAGRVYLSNGLGQWILEDGALRAWGIDAPGAPSVSASSFGGLNTGTYKVNATFLDAAGEESGCGESSTVEIAEGGGIMVDGLPATGATWLQLYATSANGEVLYAAKRLPVGITSYLLTAADLAAQGKALETQFCERVPPTPVLSAYRGRIYFAVGSRLYYTLPLRYGLIRRHETYLPMPHSITGLVATNEALYVGTERGTYRLAGDDPTSMSRRDVDAFGMVPGTPTRLARGDSVFALWWSKEGVLWRAGDDGVTPLTRNRLALPAFEAGAILHREFDGLPQIVSSLKGAGPSNSFAARDRFTAKVVRNGVVIN